ncbi:Flagellar motor switch protein FliG [Buchnera aphidicola (Eriosoma grossulariae)]|uniref:FliG C-terminal domain-containing protein n=1 Tax=Buchnera aphidicola TaxID=9 RepID=UPI003464B911
MINLNGIEKSALLLMSMDSDQVSQVLKHFTSSEIQLLISTILKITEKESQHVNLVLDEFHGFCKTNNFLNENYSQKYLLSMLKKVLENKTADCFLEEELIIQNRKKKLTILNSFSAKELAILIHKEHIQIITILLSYINRDLASQTLVLLEKKIQIEVIFRISKLNKLNRKVMVEFLRFIDYLLDSKTHLFKNINGIKISSELLQKLKEKNRKIILDEIKISNKDIVHQINYESFSFDNILDLDDLHIKFLIKKISQNKIFNVLKYCHKSFQEKFLKNMSKIDSDAFYKFSNKKTSIPNVLIEEDKKEIVMLIKKYLYDGKISFHTLG